MNCATGEALEEDRHPSGAFLQMVNRQDERLAQAFPGFDFFLWTSRVGS
jgi:hypothetical protein